jgi:hypothetical protein
VNVGAGLGGGGGASGDGGAASVGNSGTILTAGSDGYGILAQSVGVGIGGVNNTGGTITVTPLATSSPPAMAPTRSSPRASAVVALDRLSELRPDRHQQVLPLPIGRTPARLLLMERGPWYLKPQVDFDLLYFNMPSFSESGAGAFNLHFDGASDVLFAITPTLELGAMLGD